MSSSRPRGMQDTSRGPRTVLFVAGFPPDMRASELGYEFERWGRVLRCDIPAIKSAASTPYAFVEFFSPREAEEALHSMQGVRFGRFSLTVQFAKKAPSTGWRFDGGGAPPHRDRARGGERRRSRSPRRDTDRDRDRERQRDREGERNRDGNSGARRDGDGDGGQEASNGHRPDRESENRPADPQEHRERSREQSRQASATPRREVEDREQSGGRDDSPVA